MTRRKASGGMAVTGASGLDFVQAASARVGSVWHTVKRVGNAIVGGDFTGKARGKYALDIQVLRNDVTQVASGESAIAFGVANESSAQQSVTIGGGNIARGIWSVAVGENNFAAGDSSAAIGQGSKAGTRSAAFGYIARADTDDSVAIGNARCDGARAIAIGSQARALSNDDAVIAAHALYLQTATGVYRTVVTVPATPPTITGSRGGNAALASLLTALATLGVITDNTT